MKRRKAWLAGKAQEEPRLPREKWVFTYVPIARLEVEDFIAICDKLVEGGEKLSPRKRQWIAMIEAGKLTCSITNTPVAYLSYDTTNHVREQSRTFHFNFYNDKDELITVDHVYPKSLGGSVLDLENLQPMVGTHNWKKSSSLDYSPTN